MGEVSKQVASALFTKLFYSALKIDTQVFLLANFIYFQLLKTLQNRFTL